MPVPEVPTQPDNEEQNDTVPEEQTDSIPS